MKKSYIFFALILFSCSSKQNNEIDFVKVDSLLKDSKEITDSLLIVLPKSDKKVIEQVERVSNKIQALEQQVSKMEDLAKNNKTKIIRDTVFITEKKNFWGKTKTKIDSTKNLTEDSIENKNQ